MPEREHPLIARYREFSPTSEALSQRSRSVFPGGDTRSSAHYGPYPLVIESAAGAVMRDADGHELAHRVESAITGALSAVREVQVHVEPYAERG